MPSLHSLTGRPTPMAWPDPAAMAEQPKTSNVRRSQWPFLVQGEVDIAGPQPHAKGKAEAAAQRAQSPAPSPAPAVSHGSLTLAGGATITGVNVGAITARALTAGASKACEIASRTCETNTVSGVFPGALHTNSVTAAWAMSNGLGHLVRKP